MTNAKNYIKLTGTAHWANVTEPNQLSGKYQMDLTIDAETAKRLTQVGIKIKKAEKADDKRGTYVTMKSQYAPLVMDENLVKTEPNTRIGNGSKVNVVTHAYDWKGKFGTGTSLGLDSIQIMELVEFKDPRMELLASDNDENIPF